jgi:hypothetical protein
MKILFFLPEPEPEPHQNIAPATEYNFLLTFLTKINKYWKVVFFIDVSAGYAMIMYTYCRMH